ncbi:MAG: hypothetical protein Q9162_001339 [Coniocarpon cinnabarinum]
MPKWLCGAVTEGIQIPSRLVHARCFKQNDSGARPLFSHLYVLMQPRKIMHTRMLPALACFLVSVILPISYAALQFDPLQSIGNLGSHFGYPGNATFDYVIVGGGTAGLAMANRLSANGSTVAVVEAGSFYELDNGNRTAVPARSLAGTGNNPAPYSVNPKIDWMQRTEPQPALNGLEALYPSGKTLGGSSARNYEVYQRGTVESYQMWADAVDDQSYTFDNLLPFFKKSVTAHPPETAALPNNLSVGFNASSFGPNGGNGPVQVSYPAWTNAFESWAGPALNEIGVPTIEDLESGHLLGFAYPRSTQDPATQERSSAESAYLRHAMVNPDSLGLVVFTNSYGRRILFDDTKCAIGVIVSTFGQEYTLAASKEVIVSAGAIRSPQLLMVSGIGPRATLESLDIPVISDRPAVGQNMWDHVLFGPSWRVNLITHSILHYDEDFTAQAVDEYNNNRTGMMTSLGGGLLGWEKIPAHLRQNLRPETVQALDTQFPADWPEVEFLVEDAWIGYQTDTLLGAPPSTNNYVSLALAIITTFSRGNVTINSTNTEVNPVVSPNWLLDERDMDMAIQLYRRAREFFNATSLQPILLGEEAFPGMNVSTDAEIEALIRQSASTVHHAACTSKSIPGTDHIILPSVPLAL